MRSVPAYLALAEKRLWRPEEASAFVVCLFDRFAWAWRLLRVIFSRPAKGLGTVNVTLYPDIGDGGAERSKSAKSDLRLRSNVHQSWTEPTNLRGQAADQGA